MGIVDYIVYYGSLTVQRVSEPDSTGIFWVLLDCVLSRVLWEGYRVSGIATDCTDYCNVVGG